MKDNDMIIKVEEENVSGIAMLPILLFVVVYVGVGIYMVMRGVEDPFYQISPVIAIGLGIIFAFFLIRRSFDAQFDSLMEGFGDKNLVMMLAIFLLAGAFSTVSKSMGGVDSVVNLSLSVIPPQFLTAGIYLISCFISMGTGTSLGTIGALAPITISLAEKADINLPLILGAMICGTLFGDNLSVISDTTIAATRTQNVEMRDKFRVNLLIALPPAVITLILFAVFGYGNAEAISLGELDYSVVKVLPYILILVLALAGMNVYKVLLLGTVVSGAIGIAYGDLTPIGVLQNTYDGFTGMTEVFLCSFLMCGLVKMIADGGGINWVLKKCVTFIRGKKTAEFAIAMLAFITNCAIANNTVSIIITGPVVKKLGAEYKVDPRKSASLIDIFCCISDGLVPHSTQLIMTGGFAAAMGFAVSPLDILPYLWYLILLGVFGVISVFLPYSDHLIKKDPWNFEYDVPESKLGRKE